MTDAHTLTIALGGRWNGHYGSAPCPAHEDRHPSLSITDGADGRLLAKCHAGCSYEMIVAALHTRGLLASERDGSRPFVPVRPPSAASTPVNDRNIRAARSIWEETRHLAGTPAEAYLRNRGITCSLSSTLRFHPRCRHPSGRSFPALVALVEGAEALAIHRTFLLDQLLNDPKVQPRKMMLASVRGGAVRLSLDADPAPRALVVAEGIETSLSLRCGLLPKPPDNAAEWSVWAALSAGGMAALRLPPEPGALLVATDGDHAGQEAGHTLATRAHTLGWRVSLLRAPEGQDFNDVLLEEGALQ